jgi:hypothetical protein
LDNFLIWKDAPRHHIPLSVSYAGLEVTLPIANQVITSCEM